MLLGILSDTHGMVEMTRRALRMFESFEVDQIIHCGDIGTAAVVDLFAAWPTHFVFGNCDDRNTLKKAIAEAGATCHDRFGSLECEGKRIAFLHSDDGGLFQQTLSSGDWDLVCYGHTHEARFQAVGKTLALNPGALSRTSRPSAAVMDVPAMTMTSVLV